MIHTRGSFVAAAAAAPLLIPEAPFGPHRISRLIAGGTAWQSRGGRHIMRLLREDRNEGGRLHWIAQAASEFASFEANLRGVAASRPIGVGLHGALTGRLWHAGKFSEVQDRLKILRDSGIRAGLATHIPEVIEETEFRGWDPGFSMACL